MRDNAVKSNVNSNRIEYFDIVRGIGIIMVIMGHTGFLFDSLKHVFFGFHMPVFFVVSGMLMCIKGEENLEVSVLWKKKLKSLMIPYFWFSIIYVIIYFVSCMLGTMSWEEFRQSIIYMLTLFGDSTLWFLPALLFSETGYMVLKKVIKQVLEKSKSNSNSNSNVFVFLASILLGIVCYLGQYLITPIWASNVNNLIVTNVIDFVRGFLRAGISISFVAAGYFAVEIFPNIFGENLDNTGRTSAKSRFSTFGIGMVLLIASVLASLNNDIVDYHRIVLGNYVLFIIGAMTGSFGLVFISIGINRMRLLSFWGRNSLIIMCTHLNFYVLFGAIKWAWFIDNWVSRAKSYVFMFNIVVAALVVESILIVLINRFCPFVLGKKSIRKA